MEAVWRFIDTVWDGDDTPVRYTIAGEEFRELMELCFARADCFSMNTACWTGATQRELESELSEFRIKKFETQSWFCYRETHPKLKVNLYRACEKAKRILCKHIAQLFIWDSDEKFCSLEDLCFFRKGELFLGTVTHERICYVHIDSGEFGERLRRLGRWKENVDEELAHLSLDKLENEHHKEIEIHGCVEIPMEMSGEEFYEIWFSFLEEHNCWFGGGTRLIVDGYYVNEDGTRGAAVWEE